MVRHLLQPCRALGNARLRVGPRAAAGWLGSQSLRKAWRKIDRDRGFRIFSRFFEVDLSDFPWRLLVDGRFRNPWQQLARRIGNDHTSVITTKFCDQRNLTFGAANFVPRDPDAVAIAQFCLAVMFGKLFGGEDELLFRFGVVLIELIRIERGKRSTIRGPSSAPIVSRRKNRSVPQTLELLEDLVGTAPYRTTSVPCVRQPILFPSSAKESSHLDRGECSRSKP